MSDRSACIFCRIVDGDLPSTMVYSDEFIVAFMDINPASDGHCLVVSREHAATLFDLPEETALATMRAARRLALAMREALEPEGMNLHQANGRVAGQVVDHFHLHLIPRWSEDGLRLGWRMRQGDPARISAVASRIVKSLDGPGR